MSFGEAASAITIDILIADFFKLFYKNSPEAALEWFVYSDILEFEFPACGGINPYTLTARLGLGDLAHYETTYGLIHLLGVSRKETRR